MIFVHYEQRKVMLSQLHPFEVPDAKTDPPSELRQVGDMSVTGRNVQYIKLKVSELDFLPHCNKKILKERRRILF